MVNIMGPCVIYNEIYEPYMYFIFGKPQLPATQRILKFIVHNHNILKNVNISLKREDFQFFFNLNCRIKQIKVCLTYCPAKIKKRKKIKIVFQTSLLH